MKQFFINGVLLISTYYGSIYISVEKVILSAEILTDFRSVISTPTNINMESFARASLHLIFLILFLFFLFEWRIVVIVVYLNDLKKEKKNSQSTLSCFINKPITFNKTKGYLFSKIYQNWPNACVEIFKVFKKTYIKGNMWTTTSVTFTMLDHKQKRKH